MHCRAWPQEAAWRMLHNNLDPAVAERPEDLVVYGGSGKAARDWASFDAISRTLLELDDDETLLVQSGRPVGVLRTHEWAPRVLIANSNLVGEWDNWDEFRRLEHLGLTMYGQMTAGSWIYIGTQGILQGTYETFAAVAAKRFGGSLAGTLTLTAGAGGMGGAQPLAVTMNGGVVICADVDPTRLQRRLETRYLDVIAAGIDDAMRLARLAQADRMAQSIGVAANAVELLETFVERDEPVDIVTDQTPAHDPMMYVPLGLSVAEADELRQADPDDYIKRARDTIARHVTAMLALLDRGRRGVRLRQQPAGRGPAGRREPGLRLPRVRPRLHPPAVLRGQGPLPVGGAVGRSRRHRRDRPGGPGGVPRQRAAGPLDPDGLRPGGIPGPAGADLLAGPGRAGPDGRPVQRHGRRPAGSPRRSSSAATTSTADRWPPPTGRRRPWPTGRTPSPTGRCSTP